MEDTHHGVSFPSVLYHVEGVLASDGGCVQIHYLNMVVKTVLILGQITRYSDAMCCLAQVIGNLFLNKECMQGRRILSYLKVYIPFVGFLYV